MKLNLDQHLLDFKGFPLPTKLDDVLANMLAMSTVGSPAKMITWAINLTNEGEIDVDKADLKFLKAFIEQQPAATNIIKSQLLDEVERLENVQPMKSETVFTTSNDSVRDIERKLSNLI